MPSRPCPSGLGRLPELEQRLAAHVHYTLLIACVLVAFFLGAILSGFLVSCYCGRSAERRARRLGKDPEASLSHALSLRSLAKLNGLLDPRPKVGAAQERLRPPGRLSVCVFLLLQDNPDVSKLYGSFVPNGHAEPRVRSNGVPGEGAAAGERRLPQVPRRAAPPLHPCSESSAFDVPFDALMCLQADGELSGLPTPDSTPSLSGGTAPQRRPYESNHNCNNTADAAPGLGFVALVGNTVARQGFPLAHHHSNSLSNGHGAAASCTSLHLLEDKTVGGGDGGGGASPPRPLPQAVVDVSALDDLLKHIQEVSASGGGGIKVLTSTSSSSLFPGPSSSSAGHRHPPPPQQQLHGQSRPHQYSHSHHHSNQQPQTHSPCFGLPAQTSSSCSASSSSQQVLPERPGVSAARRPPQRHSLVRMGGAEARHRGAKQPFLARMNTNSSCNGPPAGQAAADGGHDSGRPLASSCLTRQHSYSGGPHAQRAAIVRRTVSLKPKVPPKPLFLPNTPTEAGRFGP